MSSTRGSAGVGRNAAVNGKANSTSSHGGAVGSSVPQASKKVVQSLKEIVNCPELEIYAMLKECNMDPDETVNRLLLQDPFHEVKSKREKKKEGKDTTDLRSRGGSSNRGGRGGNDRYGRAILSQFASSESGPSRTKPSYKKDNTPPYTSSSSMPVVSGSNVDFRSTGVSEVKAENKPLAVDVTEGFPSLTPPSGVQSAWSGVPGQLSMADIVKMGRPHGRAFSNVNPSDQVVNHQHSVASPAVPKYGVAGSQQLPPSDGWHHIEQSLNASMTSMSEPPVVPNYEEPSAVPFERTDNHLDDVRYTEGTEAGEHVSHLSTRKIQEESSANRSSFNDDYHNLNSNQVHRPTIEQQVEDATISATSVATNIQQLSLSKEEEEQEDEEEEEEDFHKESDSPAVKIPGHLQFQSIDCSHLSFGSFGSGVTVPFSQPFASGPGKSNIEEISVVTDAASTGHPDTRNTEYYDDEHLRTVSDGDIGHRSAASTGGYDMASQSETLKQEAVEVAPGHQYSFPPSNTFENNQQLNPSFNHSQTSSQLQNLPPFSGVTAYSNSLPSSLMQSNVQHVRDAELSYSPFRTAQSMPGNYTSSVTSVSVPTISIAEAMKTVNLAPPQPEQNLVGSSIAGSPGFPHLAMHPYSQPSLPFTNMIGYPFLPQNYAYMPSAFQQAIAAAGNSTYHQSLAASVHPQYKNNVSMSSLPQSAAVPSGYGAFGNSTSVPGNFPLNPTPPPAAPSATSISYEDVLNSQYKDAAHLLALQHQQGAPSRTMSAVPASAYYSLQQGQTQQAAGGYRQTQQLPSQHYGNLSGYPNFYHSQTGHSLEAQQAMSRDQSHVGTTQGQQQPKQPQQMWQNGY